MVEASWLDLAFLKQNLALFFLPALLRQQQLC
jgi:hypothetical protein